MKKHALYIRVSTEAQAEEGFSISAQSQRLQGYATAMGWDHSELFIDGGFSGSNLNRPAISQLIQEVKNGIILSVVVYKLDRLSRSQKDTLFLIEDVFLPQGVAFISLNESIDTSTPYGRAMIGIMSAFAQLERENIYLRTRMGMLERVKQGFWMGGGTVPFGYNYDKEQGILVENPEESLIVQQVYQLYLQGESPQKIAQKLNLRYDKMVMQIINRRSNLGLIPYKGNEYVGKHRAIISQELFDKAQEKRKSRQIGLRLHTVHLLSGLIFCEHCGSRLRYVKWGKKGYKLRCYSQDPSKNYMNTGIICTEPAIWAKDVEDIVLADIKSISADLTTEKSTSPPFVQDYQKNIQQLQGKLKRLYLLFCEEDDDILRDTIAETKEKILFYQNKIEEEKDVHLKSEKWAGLQEKIYTLGDTWNLLRNDQKQEIIRDCVSKIVISQDNIQIYYHFSGELPL